MFSLFMFSPFAFSLLALGLFTLDLRPRALPELQVATLGPPGLFP